MYCGYCGKESGVANCQFCNPPKEFKLFYHCKNCGDGSVSVKFHQTKQEAEKADEAQIEGWGESSVSSICLKFENNKLFLKTYQYDDEIKQYRYVWIEVKSN